MSGIQVKNGKAFEYACLNALHETLFVSQEVVIVDTLQLNTASRAFANVQGDLRDNLLNAARAAARVIIRLEPQLQYPDKNKPLFLSLQADAKGKEGDVRDVLCIRKQNDWEIGLSCKHNHKAVKHQRLSDTIDFGKEWFGIPCSRSYFDEIMPYFDELREIQNRSNNTALWSDLANKKERFYVPILCAFINELKRLDKSNPNIIPENMIHYLVGRKDFYKVIADDIRRTTRVEGINLYGTLNRPSGIEKTIVNIEKLKFPTCFYHVGLRRNSQTTVMVACDEGWEISMRLHNAASKVEPSLKFDVNIVGMPNRIHAQVEPWSVVKKGKQGRTE